MSTPEFRSRWQGWTPDDFGKPPVTHPSKPSKPGSDGFEGAYPDSSPEFQVVTEAHVPAPSGARVLPFAPDRHAARRARTVARLQGFPCPSCGSPDGWVVNARGDAWCRPCEARRQAEEAQP